MDWQTKLDRAVLREVENAASHPERKDDVAELLQDYLRLKPGREESYFPLGFAEATLDVHLDAYSPEELAEDAARWHRFGWTIARNRPGRRSSERNEEGGEDAAVAELSPDFQELLQDPRIARDLLPMLLKQSLADGDLEQSVKVLESVLSSGAPDDQTGDLLRGTLSEILRRAERPRDRLDTSSVLDLLRRCMDLQGFHELPAELRAPFHRTLGKMHQHVEDYTAAADQFRQALEIAGDGHTLASVLHFDVAACLLGIRGVPDLEPDPDRTSSDEALEHLGQATSDPKRASFNAFFARGILRFEKGAYAEAAEDLRAALQRIEQYRNPLPVTLARMRYYLALSLLQGGAAEDREEAVRELDRALERVRPDLATLEAMLPGLAEEHPKTAARLLSRIDVTHCNDASTLVRIAEQYLSLSAAEDALRVAELALERAEELELRKRGLGVELRAYNMLGDRDGALDTLYELRDLCYQGDDLDRLEELLFDDDAVGAALDRVRLLSERRDLLLRRPGREEEANDALRAIAKHYLDRAEPHWKQIGLQVLTEASRGNAAEFEEDLEAARDLAGEAEGPDADEVAAAVDSLGGNRRLLVLGGDDHQDRREDDLSDLDHRLGVESEWWATDYVHPDRIGEALEERLRSDPPAGLLILHWNRNELVRDVRRLCRNHRVPSRFCYFVGLDALEAALADLIVAAGQRRGDAAGA